MKGLGRCAEAPEDSAEYPEHCVHPHPDGDPGDLICCWCGDLFVDEPIPDGPHGEYQPEHEKQRLPFVGLQTMARASGCEPIWHNGIHGYAWHCSCPNNEHGCDQQCSMITEESLTEFNRKRFS